MASFNYQDYLKSAEKQLQLMFSSPRTADDPLGLLSFLKQSMPGKLDNSTKFPGNNSKQNALLTRLGTSTKVSDFSDKELNRLLSMAYPMADRIGNPKTGSGGMVLSSSDDNFSKNWNSTVAWHNSLPPPGGGVFSRFVGQYGPSWGDVGDDPLSKFKHLAGLSPEEADKWMGKYSSGLQSYIKQLSAGPGIFGQLLRAAPGLLLGGLATGGLSALGNMFTDITGLAPSQVGTFGNLFSLLTGGANTARTGSSLIAGNITSPQFLASAAAGGTGLTGGGILSSLSGASLSDITRLLGAGTQLAGLFAKPPELPSASSSAFTPKATALLSRNDLAIQDSAAKVAQAERERRGRGATILTSGKGLIDQLGGINRPAGRQAELLG